MKKTKWLSCVAVVTLLISFLLIGCDSSQINSEVDGIKMPSSYTKYEGENYLDVYENLKELGFYNIEFKVIEDLITGWLVSDGEVEYVSIDGEDSFRRGDIFDKNSQVVIAYHTFKSDTSSGTEQKPTGNETYYNVTFDENGGTDVSDLKFKAGYEINIYQDIDSSTKEGYLFLGWYFENGDPFPSKYKIEENISLVAHWEKILPSDWECAFQRDAQDYSTYYMFDADTNRFVTFSTSDNYIGTGDFIGDIKSQSPVKLIYDSDSIYGYEQFQNIGSYGILTDFNGYKFNFYVEPYPYRAEAILNEIKSQRGDLEEENQDSTVETQGEIYEYAYCITDEEWKIGWLFDIDEDRFVYYEYYEADPCYYEEGDIKYNSMANGFKLGEMMRLYYDNPADYVEFGFDYFTPNEEEGIFSMYVVYEDPEYEPEWVDLTIERDFNVAEAERLLEEIKNN